MCEVPYIRMSADGRVLHPVEFDVEQFEQSLLALMRDPPLPPLSFEQRQLDLRRLGGDTIQ